jgi:hypothetical protein
MKLEYLLRENTIPHMTDIIVAYKIMGGTECFLKFGGQKE